MDFKDKLNLYRKNEPEKEPLPTSADITQSSDILGGELKTVDGISYRKYITQLPLSSNYGFINFQELFGDINLVYKHSGIKEHYPIQSLLFLDLETTSLSLGTGNYPFLIGFGRIEGNSFVTYQYFMQELASESFIQKEIVPFFQEAKALVTYNGKTFDVPLIKNRFRLTRIPGFPMTIPVVDLIYHSRRLYKHNFLNCRLMTLEKELVGFDRGPDIEGWAIPQAYFDFQREGTTDLIPQIISHNVYDIETMLALILILEGTYELLENREFHLLKKESIISIAGYIFHADKKLFADIVTYLGNDIMQHEKIYRKHITMLKQQERFNEAIPLLESVTNLYTLEELAKYYEHREKNYNKALTYTREALNIIELNNKLHSDSRHENFLKRENRLLLKLSQNNLTV